MAFTNTPAWAQTGQNPFTNVPNFNNLIGSVDKSGNLPFQTFDPAILQAIQGLGWTGGNPILHDGGSGGNQDIGPTPATNTLSPAFQAWMQQKNLGSANGTTGNSSDFALYGPNSTGPQSGVVGAHQLTDFGSDPLFMAALAAGLGGFGAIAAGGTSLSAGTSLAQGGAESAGMGLAEGAYPSSITGGSVAGETGATLGTTGATLGSTGSTLGSIGSAGSAVGGAGGLLGTGLSGSQLGGLVGAAGGLLANGSGLNSATQSNKNIVDPRIAQYIYGQDGNSGLLGGVNSLYQKQMATGGLNPLQQQGIASQQQVLQDPNYATGFNQMKQAGSGLLSQPIAGNPFTSGQRSLDPSTPQSLMQAGQAFVPQQPRTGFQPVQPGLLGSR